MGTMEQLVLDLINPTTRENALLELSKQRESFPELAPYLWHSFGTVSALLQEIISIYPLLSPHPHRPRLQPRLQRPCIATVRGQPSRHTQPVFARYASRSAPRSLIASP